MAILVVYATGLGHGTDGKFKNLEWLFFLIRSFIKKRVLRKLNHLS